MAYSCNSTYGNLRNYQDNRLTLNTAGDAPLEDQWQIKYNPNGTYAIQSMANFRTRFLTTLSTPDPITGSTVGLSDWDKSATPNNSTRMWVCSYGPDAAVFNLYLNPPIYMYSPTTFDYMAFDGRYATPQKCDYISRKPGNVSHGYLDWWCNRTGAPNEAANYNY